MKKTTLRTLAFGLLTGAVALSATTAFGQAGARSASNAIQVVIDTYANVVITSSGTITMTITDGGTSGSLSNAGTGTFTVTSNESFSIAPSLSWTQTPPGTWTATTTLGLGSIAKGSYTGNTLTIGYSGLSLTTATPGTYNGTATLTITAS